MTKVSANAMKSFLQSMGIRAMVRESHSIKPYVRARFVVIPLKRVPKTRRQDVRMFAHALADAAGHKTRLFGKRGIHFQNPRRNAEIPGVLRSHDTIESLLKLMGVSREEIDYAGEEGRPQTWRIKVTRRLTNSEYMLLAQAAKAVAYAHRTNQIGPYYPVISRGKKVFTIGFSVRRRQARGRRRAG